MKFWKFTFTLIVISILTFGITGASQTIIIPSNYAVDGLPIEETLSYKISESNGVVYGWGTFAGTYAIEVGGIIEISLLNFHETWMGTVPYFNLTFRYANGQINATIANVSNIDAAWLFTLNFGIFTPGIICPIDWNANNVLAINQSNTPALDLYSPNGTLSILEENGRITYNYRQNPMNGFQNTTLTYTKSTGVIYSWNSEFYGYYLKAQLEEEKNPFEITSFLPSILALCGLLTCAVIILQKRRKREDGKC
jgi:hypothetical protein